MEYAELSDFLRRRREALQPEDVGMPRGRRRRTPGLRREEVAALAVMSADYYSRLEGGRGPQPSEEMLAAIARALRLTLAERDHLFVLAGHGRPARSTTRSDHVNPALLLILDRLDTPAWLMNRLGETLAQNQAHIALDREHAGFEGFARSSVYRWFTDDFERQQYAEEGWDKQSRLLVSTLRSVAAVDGPKSRAAAMAAELRSISPQFDRLWAAHEIGVVHSSTKRYRHRVVGELELFCQILAEPEQQQILLVYTATPGTESAERLELLTVVGSQQLT